MTAERPGRYCPGRSSLYAQAKLGEPIPQQLIDVLQHIILAHHGTYEFGSPRTPSTPEAIAVHTLENMDAKLMMSLGATRGETGAAAEGNWTEYMKAFSGKLYRPDVAPPDEPETPSEPQVSPQAQTQARTQPQPQPQREPAAVAPREQGAPQPVTTAAPAAPITNGGKPKPVLTNPLFEAIPPRKG